MPAFYSETLMSTPASTSSRSRRLLEVRGVVQGVGFRPTVYRLAVAQGLSGFVRNGSDGVTIEIEGDEIAVQSFDALLRNRLPVAARIEAIEIRDLGVLDEQGFRVDVSMSTRGRMGSGIPADLATCEDCLRELFDPADRRFRYPFTTCTNCGPRFTIVRALPYDRSRTTMSGFPMCGECQAEYDDPLDRRFHSETNACASCGPRLAGEGDPIRETVERLIAGQIVAVKGIGGFHLAVDAMNENAVARLRQKKQRPHKPFAVMARDLGLAGEIAFLDESARAALTDTSRPIVCLPKRSDPSSSVAPGLGEIGVMLPYAPLHHLLLADGPPILVMTSGNRADEPIAIDNDEAIARLSGIADAFLFHDRPIHARADDSVVRIIASKSCFIRRSRGVVPDVCVLPFTANPVVAVGAELKNTICVTDGHRAYLSPHIGDLSHPEALRFFEATIASMTRLVEDPAVVVHDLHPDYRSTRWAMRCDKARVAVQHHHAHVASCLADNGRSDRVIGVAFDGTGCGPDAELWGGEVLVCDLHAFTRAGHLRAIGLPGGEAAIREPWRLAAAALVDAGEPLDLLGRIPQARLSAVRGLIERDLRTPRATSAGRWFDAVAALCGLCDTVSYEGQAAMELESVAAGYEGRGMSDEGCRLSPLVQPYPFAVTSGNEIDLRPAVRAIVADIRCGVAVSQISARFHETLVHGVAGVCERISLRTVALSGGCFQNRRLTERMKDVLEYRGFEVLLHRQVPPNDGGIALGQAAVAAFRTVN